MRLISKVFLSQVCLILWMASSILTYLIASAHVEMMLPTGSASYVQCVLRSSNFSTRSMCTGKMIENPYKLTMYMNQKLGH